MPIPTFHLCLFCSVLEDLLASRQTLCAMMKQRKERRVGAFLSPVPLCQGTSHLPIQFARVPQGFLHSLFKKIIMTYSNVEMDGKLHKGKCLEEIKHNPLCPLPVTCTDLSILLVRNCETPVKCSEGAQE